jgi:hypothetical protein
MRRRGLPEPTEQSDFDFTGLRAALEAPDAQLHLVMIQSQTGGTYQTYHLELDRERVQAPFRVNLAASLHHYSKGRQERYEDGWAPQHGEMAVAELDQIASELFAAVDAGLHPDRLGRLAASGPDETGADPEDVVYGYAVVVTGSRGQARLFRRRDPVERLGRGRLSTVLRDYRLDRIDHVLAFDSAIDVAEWQGRLLIRSLGAFEALFFPRAVRTRIAQAVVDRIKDRLPISNVEGLKAAAKDDTVFAGRLRRLERSRLTSAADPASLMDEMRRAIDSFGLASRFLTTEGKLAFPSQPRWRWPFLSVLEDGLVRSTGSDALYFSESKRHWDRRRVTGVTRDDGRVTSLCGDGWGSLDIREAASLLGRARISLYVETPDGPDEILTTATGHGLALAVGGEVGFSSLPDCVVSADEASQTS